MSVACCPRARPPCCRGSAGYTPYRPGGSLVKRCLMSQLRHRDCNFLLGHSHAENISCRCVISTLVGESHEITTICGTTRMARMRRHWRKIAEAYMQDGDTLSFIVQSYLFFVLLCPVFHPWRNYRFVVFCTQAENGADWNASLRLSLAGLIPGDVPVETQQHRWSHTPGKGHWLEFNTACLFPEETHRHGKHANYTEGLSLTLSSAFLL